MDQGKGKLFNVPNSGCFGCTTIFFMIFGIFILMSVWPIFFPLKVGSQIWYTDYNGHISSNLWIYHGEIIGVQGKDAKVHFIMHETLSSSFQDSCNIVVIIPKDELNRTEQDEMKEFGALYWWFIVITLIIGIVFVVPLFMNGVDSVGSSLANKGSISAGVANKRVNSGSSGFTPK